MSRNSRLYLEDIKHCCEKVIKYTDGLSFTEFQKNELIYDAVLRNLEVIGEAAKNVPDDFRMRYQEIEWRKISGFRDIAAHQYFSISDSIVWDILSNKIPQLLLQIDTVLNEM
jgi:uncharacterized protein with HEPN domain